MYPRGTSYEQANGDVLNQKLIMSFWLNLMH